MSSSGIMWDFTLPSDLTLQVGEQDFFVHRAILTKLSPVFQVMLESPHFIEKDLKVIKLPDKNPQEIQQLLSFMYPFGNQVTGKTELKSLLALSQEYQINKIKMQCEIYLLQSIPTIDTLILAEHYHYRILQAKCLEAFGACAMQKHHEHPRFKELSGKSRTCILTQQLIATQNYCKKISNIALGSSVSIIENSPINVKCGHKPKGCPDSNYFCQNCRASIMRSFIRRENHKLGLY